MLDAEKEREAIIQKETQKAEGLARKLLSQAEREAQAEKTAQIAEVNTQLKVDLAQKKDLLYNKVLLQVKDEIVSLSQAKKVAIVKELYKDVEEKIKTLSLEKKEFKFSVWNGMPKGFLKGKMKANLNILAVHAESKEIFLEESLENRLIEMKDFIARKISEKI